jgi:hypothetical protein
LHSPLRSLLNSGQPEARLDPGRAAGVPRPASEAVSLPAPGAQYTPACQMPLPEGTLRCWQFIALL